MHNPRPLVAIEGPDIVIRIAIDALPVAFAGGVSLGSIPEGVIITDAAAFAEHVVHELLAEEEDGTTDVHKLFDTVMWRAVENGAEGVEEAPAQGTDP